MLQDLESLAIEDNVAAVLIKTCIANRAQEMYCDHRCGLLMFALPKVPCQYLKENLCSYET